MKKIKISEFVKNKIPTVSLGILSANIKYSKYNGELWTEITSLEKIISQNSIDFIKEVPQIHSTREGYKKLGKEPSRYRPSAEALFRRIIQGKSIYQISNLVDTINLCSLLTGYSIGGYDEKKICGDIVFDKGDSQTQYQAIGRGIMNIENLPVFYDEIGAFGSPTSDSERTKISENTDLILLVVLNFGGHNNLSNDLNLMCEKFEKYCDAKNMLTEII